MKKLILIDGNAIFHRAYHSLPPTFRTSKGEVTNAVYGFLRMLFDIYKREKPEYLGIAWDRAAPTFRHQEFKEYKATRSAPPDDLYPQLPRLKEILTAFNIPLLEKDGYEADDVLGTMAHEAAKDPDVLTIIVTGDRDSFQLVTEKTQVLMPVKGISECIVYDPAKVKEKMGVRPDQIIDYKALCGDASDNIPGVPGIGPKATEDLLHQYETLDNIYAHLAEIKPDSRREKLTNGKESAYMSRKIATILIDAPVDFNLDACHTKQVDYPKVRELFTQLEFNSLIKKLDELERLLHPETKPVGPSPHTKPVNPDQASLF